MKFIILDVFQGDETPYYYSSDGTTEAYIRVGNESVPANSGELKRLVLRGKNSSFDSLPSTYDFKDYSFSSLRARYKKWTGKSFEDTQFESFGVVDENGSLPMREHCLLTALRLGFQECFVPGGMVWIKLMESLKLLIAMNIRAE